MAAAAPASAPRNAGAGIRVCARFRPQNKLELKQKAVEVVSLEDGTTARVGKSGGTAAPHVFTFDQVFGTSSTQAEVYAATAQPLVASALQGYNCTCFVYGQTGTGKTFSMEGVPGDDEYAGIIPRVMNDVFDGIENMQAELEFIVRVSYMEIYLEKIRDLLEPSSNNLSVRESRERGVWVAGATEVCCASAEEMMSVMRLGGANRVISSTRMNNDSSRSHSVFIITIEQRNVTTGSTKSGKLFLVDLAGSEKVGKTHAKGQTLKEAQHINKSLSALGSVMNALTSGQTNAHIPYRDSKLTRLLQDSLGGNSETTLLVCGSCSSYNAEETISTLRFGARAKNIKNKPKVNEERTVAEFKQLLLEKDQVIAALQAQLQKVANVSPSSGPAAAPTEGLKTDEVEQAGSVEGDKDAALQAKQIQVLVAKVEQLEDEQASKIAEVTTLEERVIELEATQKDWQQKELELTKASQLSEELTSKLEFAKSELAVKAQEYEQMQAILEKSGGGGSGTTSSIGSTDSSDAVDELSLNDVGSDNGGIETQLLRQRVSAQSKELQLCTTRMLSLAEELENCRGFYERQISVLQEKVKEYDAHVLGFMELAESDDKAGQLDSLLQKSKMLRSVRGGAGQTGPTRQPRNSVPSEMSNGKPDASSAPLTSDGSSQVANHADPYYRPRFVSASSSSPDGWTLDEEVFPMAPIDMDSPVVKRLIASMPEKGREKMYKWLVFVLEGRDIRSNFHPEISMEGINDEISRDMRRLILPLLKKRQDIDVATFVRTRFVKVSDLKIRLVHRHGDTMHLETTPAGQSADSEEDDTTSVDSSMPGSRDLGKMWAKGHLFFGPKSDAASDSVLHGARTVPTNTRVDHFVSEPVDMSASILESKNILSNSAPPPKSSDATAAARSMANAASTLRRSLPPSLSRSDSRDRPSQDGSENGSVTGAIPGSGRRVGGMFNRLKARKASMGMVLGDVKSALTARYHKHHVHDDTMCDGCGMSPIVGGKWKCNTCESYELCDNCYGMGMHGCEVSPEMCRRVEQQAVARHRVLGNYPELFALLRIHICDDDATQFRPIVDWLSDIVSGKPVAQLRQKSIVKSGLHPEIRARLVAQLGALASERMDIELKTEWFVPTATDDEVSVDGDTTTDDGYADSEDGRPQQAKAQTESVDGVAYETLKMFVLDGSSTDDEATNAPGSNPREFPMGGYSSSGYAHSITSDGSSNSIVSAHR